MDIDQSFYRSEEKALSAIEVLMGRKYKYVIYCLSSDGRELVTLKKSQDSSYATFLEDLPESECRIALYYFEFERKNGKGKDYRRCFMEWTPDGALDDSKAIYTSLADELYRRIMAPNVDVRIAASKPHEINYETVYKLCDVPRPVMSHMVCLPPPIPEDTRDYSSTILLKQPRPRQR